MRTGIAQLMGSLKAEAAQQGVPVFFNPEPCGCLPYYGLPMRAGIAQLMGSLKAEAAQQGVPVGVHTLSPGMVLTNLLLEGASDTNKQARLPANAGQQIRSLRSQVTWNCVLPPDAYRLTLAFVHCIVQTGTCQCQSASVILPDNLT